MPLIAIIIPCFNEEKRLAVSEITGFLAGHPDYHFIFVDDGSTDNTGQLLSDMAALNKEQITKLELTINKGKAYSVREGFRLCLLQKKFSYIGYWDADFSTSLTELLRVTSIVRDQKLEFAFGSRMKKLNATIKRSGFRHVAGRITTTVVDSYYDLGIYDTQCGAKLFSASLAEIISKEPFVTNWLFDIEIFLRIRKYAPAAAGEEIPLLDWTSKQGSKINVLNAPQVVIEIIKLMRAYSNKQPIHE